MDTGRRSGFEAWARRDGVRKRLQNSIQLAKLRFRPAIALGAGVGRDQGRER